MHSGEKKIKVEAAKKEKAALQAKNVPKFVPKVILVTSSQLHLVRHAALQAKNVPKFVPKVISVTTSSLWCS